VVFTASRIAYLVSCLAAFGSVSIKLDADKVNYVVSVPNAKSLIL